MTEYCSCDNPSINVDDCSGNYRKCYLCNNRDRRMYEIDKLTTLKFKKIHLNATAPTKNTEDDAGIDLYALEDVIVPSLIKTAWSYLKYKVADMILVIIKSVKIDLDHEIPDNISATKVKTGIALEIPKGMFGKIEDRSSMGSKLLKTLGGVIDSGYRGDVTVCLANLSFKDYYIKAGDKIAQIIIKKYEPLTPVESEELQDSSRGEKGFGSSGT